MGSSTEAAEGSVEAVVHRLVRFSLNAVRGVAYVPYESEDARRVAEARWMDALRERGQAVESLDLWSHRDVDEAAATLLATIRQRGAAVLSVTGFGPMMQAMGDDWRALNYRREQWYEPAVRQVWWVPARFDGAFRRLAPDLYSWFIVKEPLTERVQGEAIPMHTADEGNRADAPDDSSSTATRESDASFERFQNGLRQGAAPEDLVGLLAAVAGPLFDAGQGAEARRRAGAMLDRLLAGTFGERFKSPSPALRAALARVGNYFAGRTDVDTAGRLLEVLGPERIAALPDGLRADVVVSLGRIASRGADLNAARARYEEARALYRRVGSQLGEANAVQMLGDVALRSGDLDAARARYQEALPLYRRLGEVQGEATCVQNLGAVALRRAELDEARAHLGQAWSLFQRIGDPLGEANVVLMLGQIELLRRDLAAARVRYEEALTLFRRVGSVLGEANCVQGFGDIAREAGDEATARERYEAALALYGRIGDPYSAGTMYLRLSRLEAISDQERAEFRSKAAAAWRSIGRDDLVARYLPGLSTGVGSPD